MNQKTAKKIRKLVNLTFPDLEDVDYEFKERIISSRDLRNQVVHREQKVSKDCKRGKIKSMKRRWNEQYN